MFDEGEKGEIPAEEILEVERNVEYGKNKFSKKKKNDALLSILKRYFPELNHLIFY